MCINAKSFVLAEMNTLCFHNREECSRSRCCYPRRTAVEPYSGHDSCCFVPLSASQGAGNPQGQLSRAQHMRRAVSGRAFSAKLCQLRCYTHLMINGAVMKLVSYASYVRCTNCTG